MSRLSQLLREIEMRQIENARREALAQESRAWLSGIVEAVPVTRCNPAQSADDPLALDYEHRPLTTNYLISQRDQIGVTRAKRGK
jgi:hypothetical protein